MCPEFLSPSKIVVTSAFHIKPDIVLSGKPYSFLDVMRFGSIDDIDRILSYIARMKQCWETSIMLPVWLLDTDRIIGMECRLAVVDSSYPTRLQVESVQGVIANCPWWQWLKQPARDRGIQFAPFLWGWPAWRTGLCFAFRGVEFDLRWSVETQRDRNYAQTDSHIFDEQHVL
jgi:hypothetical protein